MCVSIQEEKNGHHKQYAQGRIITKSKIECGGVNTPRWRGSVTRANTEKEKKLSFLNSPRLARICNPCQDRVKKKGNQWCWYGSQTRASEGQGKDGADTKWHSHTHPLLHQRAVRSRYRNSRRTALFGR